MTRLLLAATSVCACFNAFKQTRLCKQIFNYDEIIIQFFTFVAEICKIFQKSVTKNHKKRLQRLKIRAGGGAFVFLWNFLGLCLGLWNFLGLCLGLGNFFGFVEFLGFVWNVLRNFLGICLIFFKNSGEILNLFGNFKILLEKIWIFWEILKNLVILSFR